MEEDKEQLSLEEVIARKPELISRREELSKELLKLQADFVDLEQSISIAVDAKGQLLPTRDAVEILVDFRSLYRRYDNHLKQAELLGIIEPGFEKQYRELYAKADDYEFVEVKQGKPFPPDRYADEEGKIFYQWNRHNLGEYFSYSVLAPERTEIQGTISQGEAMALLQSKGIEENENLLIPKILLDLIIKRGHILPLWKDNPYLKEIKDETMRLQLRNMPEIEQLERDIRKARESADSAGFGWGIAGIITSITVILPIIAFIGYKIHVGIINDEIAELEAKKSSLVQELEAKKEELTQQGVEEAPLKQSIYTQMQSINTLFKPLKEELIKRKQIAEEDSSLSKEEKRAPKH